MSLGMSLSRRAVAFLVVAAVAAAVAFVPAGAAGPGKVRRHSAPISQLRVGLEYAITTLDQTQSTAALNQTLGLSLDQLVQIGPGGKVHPWLAQSVTRPNPTTFVYHLRHGVKFWDGNVMTSKDVADSLNYWRAKGSQAAFLFGTVKSIAASGPATVTIKLLHPDAAWQTHLAAAPGIFESAFRERHKASFGKPGTLVQATGPWQPLSLDPNTSEELEANPHYWHGPVNIQHISMKFFQSETSMAVAYRTGGIDLAFPFDGQAFQSTSKAKMTYAPSPVPLAVGLDTISPHWSDIHVRKAVAWAINRGDMARALAQPTLPTSTIIPPSELYALAPRPAVDALLKRLPKYTYNLARAKQEMAKSKYPNGFTADLNTLQGFGFYNLSQVLARDLQQIGIKLNIHIVPIDKWLSIITGSNRKAAGIQLTTPSSGSFDVSDEPSFILGSVNAAAGGFNMSNWHPADVDKLIAAGVATENPTKRLQIYGKILQRVAEDVPYVPILLESQAIALSPKFSWPSFPFYYVEQPWALQIRGA
jgi:peptide/nickel transport system substrate-binding protein